MISRLFNLGLRTWARKSAKRLQKAAQNVEAAQRRRLSAIMKTCAGTARGNDLGLDEHWTYERFVELPVTEYDDYQPYIDRIMAGEPHILTNTPVTLLEPTSGSSSGSKLIPYTQGLQQEFQEGINAWLWSLYRQHPGVRSGRQYWSISPSSKMNHPDSAVSIGFDDDASYLGTVGGAFAKAVWAVPPQIAKISDPAQFQAETISCLLTCKDLTLISVWHPSFLTILLDAIPDCWERALKTVRDGSKFCRANPSRAAELSRLGRSCSPSELWPDLCMVSCWGGHANAAWLSTIQTHFPDVTIQEKGLVATEGITTIPFEGRGHALCVNSHVYEFKDVDSGNVLPAWNLEEGRTYSLILSTSGGLLRYATHDLVQVTGFAEALPLLEFRGRDNVTSDIVGEKLSLAFVETVLNDLCPDHAFKILMPRAGTPPNYVLVVQGGDASGLSQAVDRRLRENYHYDHARNLEQLGPVEVQSCDANPTETYRRVVSELTGAALGDVKLPALVTRLEVYPRMFGLTNQ